MKLVSLQRPAASAHAPARQGAALVCVGLVLAVACNRAGAAPLNSVAMSVGFFVAIAALLFAQAWPTNLTAGGFTTLVLVLAAVAWLWRSRRTSFAMAWPAWMPRAARRPVCRAIAPAAFVLPAGIDHDELLAGLRGQFVRLQAAWDGNEIEVLRALTTPEMLSELCAHLPDGGSEPNCTEVMTLRAELVGFDELASGCLASVEFSGMIRESAEGGAAPFRELWMLARTKEQGADWRLARQLDLP